jgi:hypothetical protein
MQKFTQQNQQYLQSKLGRAPTSAELYMAHNMGTGGAMKLLRGNPNAPVTSAVSAAAARANPQFMMHHGQFNTIGQSIQAYGSMF